MTGKFYLSLDSVESRLFVASENYIARETASKKEVMRCGSSLVRNRPDGEGGDQILALNLPTDPSDGGCRHHRDAAAASWQLTVEHNYLC